MEDACWTVPLFLCFGCSDAPGQGRRPACGLISRLPLLRPVALYALDLGRNRQGHQVRARLRGGWLHRYGAGKRLVQRPDGASCRRNISKFASATRSTGTTGSRLY